MKTKLLNLWESIRASLWLIPGLMVSSAIGLSFFMVAVDRKMLFASHHIIGLLYAGGPDGARSVLSTIAGSMITVAGVVFSITIVALTLTSSQFGPRLLRNFMTDKVNQVVLGTFISTFMYCLLVLRSVHTEGDHSFVPSISITFAIALAAANVGVLIYFIHHVSSSIQAERVTSAVYGELMEHIQRLFPEASRDEHKQAAVDRGRPPEKSSCNQAHHIAASQGGYIQAIDSEGLVEIAKKNDCLICIQYRAGEFIIAGSTLAMVSGADQANESAAKQIVNSFIVGPQRTPEQDAEFAIHQLVEIAIRALSPGINDPFTAISCIDRLGSALSYLSDRAFPSPYHYDGAGKLRLIAKTITFSGVTKAAFDQIRQYGRSSVAVTVRLMETLTTIAARARSQEQRQVILRQADMILRASQASLPEENDKQDVKERYKALLDVLG